MISVKRISWQNCLYLARVLYFIMMYNTYRMHSDALLQNRRLRPFDLLTFFNFLNMLANWYIVNYNYSLHIFLWIIYIRCSLPLTWLHSTQPLYLSIQLWRCLSLNMMPVRYNKGIKNGCPCIVEIRGTQGCALVGDPARAAGECRDVAKTQP